MWVIVRRELSSSQRCCASCSVASPVLATRDIYLAICRCVCAALIPVSHTGRAHSGNGNDETGWQPNDAKGQARPANGGCEAATRGRPKKAKGAAFGKALKAAQIVEQEKRAKWQRGIEQNAHKKGEKFSLVHTLFLLVLVLAWVLGVLSNPAAQVPMTPTAACRHCATRMHIN